MKQLNKSLRDFITVFDLEDPEKGICFDAKLYIFRGSIKIEAESEIQIITIDGKGLDILYILNPMMGIEDFPTMLVIGDYEISFNQQLGLKLKGADEKWGSYTLLIQPTGKDCTEPTYQELNAKTYN